MLRQTFVQSPADCGKRSTRRCPTVSKFRVRPAKVSVVAETNSTSSQAAVSSKAWPGPQTLAH
eukprot:3053930-Amphidinium_carterae.1